MKKKSMLCAVLALLFLLTGCRGRNTASAEQVHIKDYQGIPAYTQPTLSQSGSGSTAAIDPNAYVDVDIWVDGTPSMAGFVAGDLATTYRKTLPRVEETAYNTWINANVNYYRFEISMLPEDFADISGMDDYLAGSGQTLEEMTRELYAFAPITAGTKVRAYEQSSFYGKNSYYESFSAGDSDVMKAVTKKVKSIAAANWDSQTLPPLRTALTMVNPDHLSVIVSDLYEEKGRVEQIGKLMTGCFFEQGKTVAVIGVQSEFAGLIYDIGESDMTIGYGVDENRKFSEYKPHPFYLLVIGDENEVNYFAQAIKSKLDAEITDNDVYSSEIQLMKTGDWGASSDSTEVTNFYPDSNLTAQTSADQRKLDAGQVCDLRYTMPRAVSSGRGQQAEQTGTSVSAPETLSFEFTIPVRIRSDKEVDFNTFTYAGSAQVQRTVMKEVASGRRTGRGEVQETGEGLPITATVGSSRYAGDFEADETAQALVRDVTAVSVGAVTRDGDEQVCPVTFRVTMESPKEIGVYRLLLSAAVQCPADLFPTDLEPWVDEWDVSVADELTWTSDPGTFDGSKTLYLKRIMNQIVVSSNTLKTTGDNALSPSHELGEFYVDLYADQQGYFGNE